MLRLVQHAKHLHRLVNTRVLRASLALSGISDVQYERVDDKAEWPKTRVLSWREQELAMMAAQADDHDDGGASDASLAEWWTRRTGAANQMTRRQTFPHMSQRCTWSAPMLLAVLAEMQTIEDHICENVFNACIRELQAI